MGYITGMISLRNTPATKTNAQVRKELTDAEAKVKLDAHQRKVDRYNWLMDRELFPGDYGKLTRAQEKELDKLQKELGYDEP